MIYRIKDWDTRYENNRTRAYKKLDWVPMPNKMDGDGYTELVELSKGEKEYYGALRFAGWCAIVEIASRCEPRGTLYRNLADNCGHTAESLSRISRLPIIVFELVFDRAMKIGWLDVIDNQNKDLQNTAEILQSPALNRIEENRIEENRKESKRHAFTPPTEQEMIAFFLEKGFPESLAKKVFEYYSPKWIDSNGKKVLNWKQKCLAVWMKEENKDKSKTGALGIDLNEMSQHGQQTYKNAVEALGIKK